MEVRARASIRAAEVAASQPRASPSFAHHPHRAPDRVLSGDQGAGHGQFAIDVPRATITPMAIHRAEAEIECPADLGPGPGTGLDYATAMPAPVDDQHERNIQAPRLRAVGRSVSPRPGRYRGAVQSALLADPEPDGVPRAPTGHTEDLHMTTPTQSQASQRHPPDS